MGTKVKSKVCLLILFLLSFVPIFVGEAKAASNSVVINEIYFNVAADRGKDSDDEWVELYNSGSESVNLKGWRILDNKKERVLSATDLIVSPAGFVLISRSKETWAKWGELNSSSVLFIELNSLIGNGLGNSGDKLTLLNDSGQFIDGVSWGNDKTYLNLPTISKGYSYERLEAGLDRDSVEDFIKRSKPSPGCQFKKLTYPDNIRLSEILPAPEDGSRNEFIELYNSGDTMAGLAGWSLRDSSGQAGYVMSEEAIGPDQYLNVEKEKFRFSLNDDGDAVQLVDPGGLVRSEVIYDRARKGQSIALIDGSWQWTRAITAADPNQFSQSRLPDDYPLVDDYDSLAALDEDEIVRVTGRVTAPPQKLSSQYFYVESDKISLQIYSYERELPKLSEGDQVEVVGRKSATRSGLRLKIDSPQDIKVAGTSQISPKMIELGQITPKMLGRYLGISGVVERSEGSKFWLKSGDIAVRVTVRDGAGVEKPRLNKGETVASSGILSWTGSEYNLLPFTADGVKILGSGQAAETELLPDTGTGNGYFEFTFIILFTLWNLFLIAKKKPLN